MPDPQLKHYKRWNYTLAVALLLTAGFAAYTVRHGAVDPFCRGVAAKYQRLLWAGEEPTFDVHGDLVSED